jgi:hypothetical protein
MTTIVANLECMAADQRVTSSGPICHVKKLRRIGKSIFGFSGDVMLALIMIEWLNGKRDRAQLHKLIPDAHRDSVDLLELSPEGLHFWNGWGVRMAILDATYAIGSGAMPALTALRMNCTPQQALLHSPPLDECSGLLSEPEVEYLLPPELVKKRKR